MHIDMGDMIAAKQDRPSVIIEHPLRAPQIAQNIDIFYILFSRVSFWYMKNWFSNYFPLLYICLHCDELITNFHKITSIFYMLLEDSFSVKSISKCSWSLEACI